MANIVIAVFRILIYNAKTTISMFDPTRMQTLRAVTILNNLSRIGGFKPVNCSDFGSVAIFCWICGSTNI